MSSGKERASVARNVTITGTRSVAAKSALQLPGLFDDYLRPFADPGAHFYLGGAVGIDAAALHWLAEHTQASLTVVVPCTVADQPAAAGEAIRRWRSRGRLADVVGFYCPARTDNSGPPVDVRQKSRGKTMSGRQETANGR
jgi:hypothetical protein